MSKVILKRSSVSGKVPLATDLEYGELAINYADGIAYFKRSDNTIQTLVGGVGGEGVISVAGKVGVVTLTKDDVGLNNVDNTSDNTKTVLSATNQSGGTINAISGVITANSTSDALKITQLGSGNALVIEDETSPDSTPTIITGDGRIIVGSTTSGSANAGISINKSVTISQSRGLAVESQIQFIQLATNNHVGTLTQLKLPSVAGRIGAITSFNSLPPNNITPTWLNTYYGFNSYTSKIANNNYGIYVSDSDNGINTAPTFTVAQLSCTQAGQVTVKTTADHGLSVGTVVGLLLELTAPNIPIGAICTIISLGTTDFTTIGAPSNTIGTQFTATGAGVGSGVVRLNCGGTGKYITNIVDSTTFQYYINTGVGGEFSNLSAFNAGTVTRARVYNIYAGGTAQNYLEGNTGIGELADTTYKLRVLGDSLFTGNFTTTGSISGNISASSITSGTLDAARLPSYVDDVLEYSNLASFPSVGEVGKIYVALDTNKTYRWSGSTYIYITSGAVDSVAGKTGVVTLTSSDVGLGNVTNESKATLLSNPTFTGLATLSDGTSNGIAYLNSSKQLTTGNALQFNGTTLTVPAINTTSLIVGGDITWTQSTDSYSRLSGVPATTPVVTDVHRSMRRCLLRDDLTVNYYLDPTNSTLKADGTASTLTGTDGQVMVEIPAFYVKFTPGGNRNYAVSLLPSPGYTLHPAFMKDGVFVPYRYYGAYDACVFNGSVYESGLNYDNNWSGGQNWSADGINAKLSSVSGVYPAVGATRANFRSMAANRGTGWREVDFYLESAVQLLYLVEYGSFNSQANLGNGNVSVSSGYPATSGNQTDSPHSIAGKSNSLGNASTNITTGVASGTRDTAFMSYRGIENWYGNCWNWVDGFNVNNNQAYVSNVRSTFADNTATGYDSLGAPMINSNGWVTNVQQIPFGFLPSAVGGSSVTYFADYYYQNTGWRVAIFGGNAHDGGHAGAFYWYLYAGSGYLNRGIGGRLAA